MSFLDRVIAGIAPKHALQRARARAALRVLARYEAGEIGKRNTVWRAAASDADLAAGRRARLAYVARDLIRNNPWAARGQMVIANNVVGDGIIPKLRGGAKAQRKRTLELMEAHFDTTAIDAEGRNNLYGLQRLAMNTIVDAGEVLIRRRRRERRDGLPVPFQIEVLEPDFLDTGKDGVLANGNEVREGIEYDATGRRVNYWLFDRHPGGTFRLGRSYASRPVPASEIIHCYRQDRPGQMRGVSWFAAVAMQLQDLHDHQDAQLMRQKIAACFAAFRIAPDGEYDPAAEDPAGLSQLVPGRIQNIKPGEDIRFAEPPGVEGYDEFTRAVLAAISAGLGITYEALTGDLSRVNFTSGRMGRMEMDRNVSSWQWLLLIPQMLQPLAHWFWEARVVQTGRRDSALALEWVPPRRALVDPTREVPALRNEVRAGFKSRPEVIRELGYDPERVTEEIQDDARDTDARGLVFDSDARKLTSSGQAQSRPLDGAGGRRADDGDQDDD